MRWILILLLLGSSVALADDPKPARRPNHLAGETSPYLLQHAHNPVDWYPWGPEAFAKAKAENKPIFLSVGYSSCFWCHVMERESFEDAEIARALNDGFVCIKVDREERPDVDAVYMGALQAFAGGGGWPMSVFLFPDGRPFFAATYLPPKDNGDREGFLTLIGRVKDAWKDHRPALSKDADSLSQAVRDSNRVMAGRKKVALSRRMGENGQAQLAQQFDADFGGFGFDPDRPNRPKFPEPSNLVFLLRRDQGARVGPLREGLLKGPEPRVMVDVTLDHMARGGIRDHLAGGYHRYSVNRAWTVPHFEKMLYDNAQLASVHLQAFEATHDPRWKAEAEATFAFLAKRMSTPEGGFASAMDAETDGDEGGYYVWRSEEVNSLLGDDYAIFSKVYGLDQPPNFDGGRYVLQERRPRKDVAAALDMIPEALDARLVPLRLKLLEHREKRPSPRRDDKVLTAWNGLAIAALADGFRVLKDPKYREMAEKAADFLLTKHRQADGRLLRTSRGGKAKGAAYLEDYAFLAHGLLRLHQATNDPKRLTQAKALIDRMIADFSDKDEGGFFFTAADHEALIARIKDPFDNALPGANSVAIRDLVALSAATGDAKYEEVAGKALEAFSPALADMPGAVPLMLVGLEEFLDRKGKVGENPKAKDRLPGGLKVLSAEATTEKAEPGKEFEVKITLEIAKGWHIAANPSGSEIVDPTTVSLPEGAPLKLVKVEYPKGQAMASPGGGDTMSVYEGKVTLKAVVKRSETASGPIEAELLIRHQACNDRACLAPATLKVPVKTEDP